VEGVVGKPHVRAASSDRVGTTRGIELDGTRVPGVADIAVTVKNTSRGARRLGEEQRDEGDLSETHTYNDAYQNKVRGSSAGSQIDAVQRLASQLEATRDAATG